MGNFTAGGGGLSEVRYTAYSGRIHLDMTFIAGRLVSED